MFYEYSYLYFSKSGHPMSSLLRSAHCSEKAETCSPSSELISSGVWQVGHTLPHTAIVSVRRLQRLSAAAL